MPSLLGCGMDMYKERKAVGLYDEPWGGTRGVARLILGVPGKMGKVQNSWGCRLSKGPVGQLGVAFS